VTDAALSSPDPNAEWWTTTDIAAHLRVQVGTVSSYRQRGQMPEPDETRGRTHLWRPARIIAWHQGRPRPGVGGRPDELSDVGFEFLTVSTATASRAEAEALAQLAVQAKLAASAQISGPLISAFWHLGEFGTGEEWRLSLQTRAPRYAALEDLLRENHPWGNPEISALPIVAGADDYLEWLRNSVPNAE
jgi:uncharacterized protein involved in tolerance to divalent cations